MANKLLIGISAQGAVVGDWRGNRMVECRTFPDNETGKAGFRDYLLSFSKVPAYFVVDAVGEDYRFETLPRASGSDRAEMVNRKLRQHYRNTPFVSASLLGRESGKRRDDRFLFSALTNPELINDWLQMVVQRGLPIGGIYLLPMVSSALVERLGAKSPNLLVVAQHANGLRLTYFRDRQFRLSRLTSSEAARTDNRARYFAEEIANTRLYLHALRSMTLDEQLSVLLIDRTDELTQVAADVARENPSLECIALGRQTLTDRIGITGEMIGVSPYAIYLHLLGLRVPTSNLAPATVMVGFNRYRARRMVYAASGALVTAALVWTGVNLYHAMSVRGEVADAARQTALLAAQYQEITRQFPQAPTTAENLRLGVEIAQKLRGTTHTPERAMTLLSRALAESPNVIVREFGWSYGTAVVDSQRSESRTTSEPSPSTTAGVTPSGTPARRESALVEGEIRPFRGDYRSAIASINAFARRIAAVPEVAEVRVVKLPLNVNPGESLAGNTQANPDQSGATADFQLLLIMKPGA